MKKVLFKGLLIWIILYIVTSCGVRTSTEKIKSIPTPPLTLSSPHPPNIKSNTESSLRFVVMSDCRGTDNGVNSEIVTKTLESIRKTSPQPSFAIMPGDLVTGSFDYTKIKSQLTNFKNIITEYYPIEFYYPGFGNHEGTAGDKGEQAFEEVFSDFKANFLAGYHKTVYSFDKNAARVYMLNSNHSGDDHIISDDQLNWIKTNSDPGKKHNIFLFHEPAFPTGAHVGSSLDVIPLQRDQLWRIIDNSTNPIVFCGHEHNYTRRHIDKSFNENIGGKDFKFHKVVYQITSGTFGAPIYKDFTSKKNVDVPPIPQYHYALVDVNDKVKVTVYNIEGKIIDYFEQ